MKKFMILLIMLCSFSLNAKVLATIGNDQITSEDVKRFKTHLYNSGAPRELIADDDMVLDYIINMKLAVLELKSTGADQTPDSQDAIQGALYNYYLSKTVDSKIRNKKFSKQDIVNYYKKYPVVKMNRLALAFNPNDNNNKKEVFSKISVIRSELRNKKVTFEEIIDKYSKNDPTTLTGTFDKMPSAMLSSEEKEEVSSSKPLEISSILAGPSYFSIIRVIKVYPISTGDYGPINEILKATAITQSRSAQVRALRQKYSSIIDIK